MAKRNPNVPGPGFYKIQGSHVENRDAAKASKRALDREAARRKQKAAARPAAAVRRVRAKAASKVEIPPTPEVLAREHDRDFQRMNERRAVKKVKPAPVRREDYPSYLGATARGVIRRVARLAFAPLALARAVVDRVRHRD
ncbi:MAG TPA: hypothetical protein VN947_01140 [Polyangia bacterium]|nr:hypothetical protein [Polyangia bacterium]